MSAEQIKSSGGRLREVKGGCLFLLPAPNRCAGEPRVRLLGGHGKERGMACMRRARRRGSKLTGWGSANGSVSPCLVAT